MAHDEVQKEEEAVRKKPLPLEFPGVHYMDEEEVEAVTRVLRARSPFRYYGIDLQKEVESFEREFSAAVGSRYVVAVTSGTGALHTALSAVGAGPGQEILVPAYQWVAISSAVVNHGAIPILADIDDTFCMDPEDAERRITPRTTGIIAAHMSGAPADIVRIREVARRHGLFLLEDCAQCNGGSINGQKVGTFGDIGIFSFQMNKNMTSGEGGCVVTNDLRLYKRSSACQDLGYARDERGRLILNDPELCLWGRGYRLDELRAAVLRVQLKKLPRITGAMRRSKYRIRAAVQRFPNVKLRRIIDPAGDTGCFLLTTFATPEEARQVNASMRADGIVTGPQGMSNILMTEWGLHLYYNIVSLLRRSSTDRNGFPWTLAENRESCPVYEKGSCPAADSLFARTTLLPIPSNLTEQDENDIIRAFERALRA
ncbi:MAG: DegT/DnrJ/EryC1/StrS family aminotransferase [Acidobacteriota bacterium]